VLVLAADRDYTPVSAKEAYIPRLADARLVVLHDSGHASPMDQPGQVNQALLDFWQAR
jgi:3-oxoadipate enol-lactonase